jgi:hypothetical protein
MHPIRINKRGLVTSNHGLFVHTVLLQEYSLLVFYMDLGHSLSHSWRNLKLQKKSQDATENIVNTRDKMILSNSPVFDFEALNSSTNLTKNTPNPCKKPVIST